MLMALRLSSQRAEGATTQRSRPTPWETPCPEIPPLRHFLQGKHPIHDYQPLFIGQENRSRKFEGCEPTRILVSSDTKPPQNLFIG
jgi:hypothetical protein